MTKLQLEKIIIIQEITIREKRRRGRSQQWIYDNLIAGTFFISKPTYDRYLARNAKKELKELQAKNDDT